MPQLYALYQEKKAYLKKHGFEYVEMWEHTWLKMLSSDVEVKNFVQNIRAQKRLDPRDSFFGG